MHQRPRDRHPLQLAAGELARQRIGAIVEADGGEHLADAPLALAGRHAEQRQRQRDVLRDAQVRQHVERLEHEAQPFAAQDGQRVVVERRQVDAAEPHRTGVGAVEAGDQVEQRGLADARLAHDRDVIARGELEVDAGEDDALARAGVAFLERAQRQHPPRLTGAAGRDKVDARRLTGFRE